MPCIGNTSTQYKSFFLSSLRVNSSWSVRSLGRHFLLLSRPNCAMASALEGRVLHHRKRHFLGGHKWQLLKLVLAKDGTVEWLDDLKKVETVGQGVLSSSQPALCGADLNDNTELISIAKFKPEHSLGDRFALFVQHDNGNCGYEFFLAQGNVSAADWVAAAKTLDSQGAGPSTAEAIVAAASPALAVAVPGGVGEDGSAAVDPEDMLSKVWLACSDGHDQTPELPVATA